MKKAEKEKKKRSKSRNLLATFDDGKIVVKSNKPAP